MILFGGVVLAAGTRRAHLASDIAPWMILDVPIASFGLGLGVRAGLVDPQTARRLGREKVTLLEDQTPFVLSSA